MNRPLYERTTIQESRDKIFFNGLCREADFIFVRREMTVKVMLDYIGKESLSAVYDFLCLLLIGQTALTNQEQPLLPSRFESFNLHQPISIELRKFRSLSKFLAGRRSTEIDFCGYE